MVQKQPATGEELKATLSYQYVCGRAIQVGMVSRIQLRQEGSWVAVKAEGIELVVECRFHLLLYWNAEDAVAKQHAVWVVVLVVGRSQLLGLEVSVVRASAIRVSALSSGIVGPEQGAH